MTDQQSPAPPAGNQQVQLGIGTLIIIAIIVSMCSGRDEMRKVRDDTTELREQVREINQKLDRLVPKETVAPDENVEAADPAADSGPVSQAP
jgi:hypothetical protein